MAQAKPTPTAAATQAHERFVWLLLALVGQSLTLTLKSGVLVRGILSGATPSASPSSSSSTSTSSADDGLSLSLRQVVYLDPKTRQPKQDEQVKQALLVNAKDLLEVEADSVEVDPLATVKEQQAAKESAAAKKDRDTFRTDTDISADRLARLSSGGRQLQAWGTGFEEEGSLEGPSSSSAALGGLESSTNGRGWDQFAANEQRFGLKTDYEDEIYTTRLDRSGKDFKQREARAAQLEREIMKGTSSLANNAHMAEERGEQVPDVGNEEDRYGAVQRSEGAYVPPGARKAALARLGQGQNGPGVSPAPSSAAGSMTAGAPTSSATAPSASASTSSAAAAPPITSAPSGQPAQGGTVDQKFRDFVTDERKRLEAKKAQLQQQAMKKEQDSKLASLLQWSQTFKNPYPLPDDLATILGKKPSNEDRAAVSKPNSASSSTVTAPGAGSASAATSPSGGATRALPALAQSPAPALAPKKPSSSSRPLIAEIPPFNPARAKAKQAELAAAASAPKTAAAPAAPVVQAPSPSVSPAMSTSTAGGGSGLQPKAPTSKLSATAGAFVFKPNPAAASFTPGAGPGAGASPSFTPAALRNPSSPAVPIASTSSAAAPPAPSGPINPFFGPKGAHKRGSSSSSLHVKEDFTPFRHKTLPPPETVSLAWPFSGKPYRAIYPPHVFGQAGPPMPLPQGMQQGPHGAFQPQGQQQQQLPPHLAAQAQAQAAAYVAMQQQQQQQQGGGPPGSSASSTAGGPSALGATAPTLGPNGLPLPPPPPPPHALSPAPPPMGIPSGTPTPVPQGAGPVFQPRFAGPPNGPGGMPPQLQHQHSGMGPGGSMPPHFQPHHQQQQHPHHPNQHQHQQQMQQQFQNMHLAQQHQQHHPGPQHQQQGPNGLPAGVQFVPGVGLVAMPQQGGGVNGMPPQFAPGQHGGPGVPPPPFNGGGPGGQGPMFTSPSMNHPAHPAHLSHGPGHPGGPPPHLAHHQSHHASPAGHHRNYQGGPPGGPGGGHPPWFNPQQQQQQQGGGPGTPTMAPNAPPSSAPTGPSAPSGAPPPPSSTGVPSGPTAAQQPPSGAASGMGPQFVQQPAA
ncbi:hypothetical protein JCM11251_002950 [Rhodosporidiobolus azoricus]